MPSSTNGEYPYRLVISQAIAAEVGQLQYRASLEGRGEEFLQSLRTIIDGLLHRPRELGEPLYQLNALRLQVRHVVTGPVVIHFAVHKDRPLVFIKAVDLLPEK
jgi:hypothetical protein